VQVGSTVEQHQHRNVVDHAGRLVEAERHRDRHAPIEPTCRSRTARSGHAFFDLTRDRPAVAAHGEVDVVVAERSGDLVDDPVGIGGKQDVHVADATRRRPDGRRDARRSASSPSRSCTSPSSNGSTTSSVAPDDVGERRDHVEFETTHRAQRPPRCPRATPGVAVVGASGDRSIGGGPHCRHRTRGGPD
jgi:hypothetical protein